MNKLYKQDNNGFTLVELLAVIVVLAIVMLIAVQSILPRMEEARRSVFALEANEAINSAQTYWTNQSLKGSGGFPVSDKTSKCVTIDTLVKSGYLDLDLFDTSSGLGYSGYIKVTKSGSLYLYNAYIQKNATMMVNGAGSDGNTNKDITGNEPDVTAYVEATAKAWPTTDTCPTVAGGGS